MLRLHAHIARAAPVVGGVALLFALGASVESPDSGHDVTLIRDDWGVPHIYADTEPAGYYALGYAQAEDQGERVMLMALMATGQAARVEGEDMLASDVEARRWMHAKESKAGLAALSPHVRKNYRAHAAGFNRYFKDHPDEAPVWRFDLEPWHLIAIPRGLLWESYMAGHGLADCRRGGASLSQAQAASLERRARHASNMWVLHPERTADGAMMLLSDPHGGIDGGFAYEYRMHAGDLHSAGYSLGGALLLAHTRHLAWGMTTGAPDVADCYAVETDPDDPLRYRFDGEWKEMTTWEVVIDVKEGTPERRTFAYTDHNGVLSPVVGRDGATAYVVSTPYMHEAEAFDEEMDRLNHAESVEEAKHAMRDLGMFAQNLMFADVHGNSWYVRAGRAPVRPEGFDWSRPVPGNSSATAWQGLHPVEDLVQITNPPQGYMQNNNVAPDQMTAGPPPVDVENYPAYIFNDQPGRFNRRGMRTNEVLSQAQDFTVDDAIELALDEKWTATAAWTEVLAGAVDAKESEVAAWEEARRDFLEALLSFDGHARTGSSRALKYFLWRQAIYDQLSDDQVETALRAQWSDNLKDVVPDEVLLSAVGRAAEMLPGLFDRKDATLGDLVRIGIGENDYPVGGIGLGPLTRSVRGPSETTLRAFSTDPLDSPIAPFRVQGGSRLLRLVVFTDPIQSFTVHNFGQSDDPDSPHYDDQARLLTSLRTVKPVYFERHELDGHIESETTLQYDPSASN